MNVRLLCSEDAKVRVQRRSVSFRDIETLFSGFNMRVFTLLLRNYLNFWQRGWTSVSLNFRSLTFRIITDCMISSLKWLILSLLIVGFIFLEEMKPCQFEIQKIFVASSVRYVLLSLDYFPCWTTTYLLARLKAQTNCKNYSWFIHFVLDKLVNWKCGVFMFTLGSRFYNNNNNNNNNNNGWGLTFFWNRTDIWRPVFGLVRAGQKEKTPPCMSGWERW